MWGETRHPAAPAIPRPALTLVWLLAYVLTSLLGRIIIVQPHNVGVVWPASGIALVWLATAQTRAQMVSDTILLSVATGTVIALTDGSVAQSALSLLSVIQTVVAVYLIRRWVPHLWGGGGRQSMSRLSDFGRVLAAVTIGALAMAVLRTALGLAFIPDEILRLGVGRFGRQAAAMATIGVFGLLIGGWIAERRDAGLPVFDRPSRNDWLHVVGIVTVTVGIFYFGFYLNPEVPSTFMLALTVVWCAIRFNPVVTVGVSLLTGAGTVVMTIAGHGPVAQVGGSEGRALIAQVFVVVLLVIGLVIALTRKQIFSTVERLEKSEEVLAVRAEELDQVMAQLEDGVAIIEEGGAILHTNKALRTAFGSRPDEPIDHVADPDEDTGQAFHPDGRPLEEAENPVLRALAGEQIETEEFYHIDEFGVARWLQVSAYPMPHAADAPPRAMVLIRDTTAATTHRESLVSFAGTVAHDLSNPLSVIDGWAEAIEEDLSNSDSPDALAAAPMVQHIRAGVDQMRGFIADLLAHAVARDQTLDCELIPLRNLVKHIAVTRDRPQGGGDIVAGDLYDVWADRVLLRQVLDNLIGNAFKYVEPGTVPRVTIEAEKVDDNWVMVRVRDNGIGIPADQRDRVFDRFERLTADNYAGTGLGLAIVKRIVQRHGGAIRVTDNPDGVGTCFEFTLPGNAETFTSATR